MAATLQPASLLYGGPTQWIYAARIVRTGRIKIGFTIDIARRIAGLRTQFRSDVEILGLMEGSMDLERAIHRQSAASCDPARGKRSCEVYLPTEHMLSFIRRQMRHPSRIPGLNLPVYTPFNGQKPLTPVAVKRICDRILAPASSQERREKNREICLYSRIRRDHELGRDVSVPIAAIERYLGPSRRIDWLKYEAGLGPHPDDVRRAG